ncbi:MAG: HU family DNA-binding protein [Tabrizicola sp.]|nr:HU family DNA-binding protein [Tabrizicola sp.]
MAPRKSKDTEEAAAKPAKARKSAAKIQEAPEKPAKAEPPVSESAAVEGKAGTVKLKELVDAVAEVTGGKKPEVKATVEAVLSAMGAALATGKSLVVPPLGKLRVVKNRGPALTLKLRLADGPKAAGLALADDGEDS